ncbi:hypothetical protein V5799_010404, partial [Amblyomma americanum]
MRVYERAPSTSTRLGKDSTMISSSQSGFPEASPPPNERRDARTRTKLAAEAISCLAVVVGCIIFLWGISQKMKLLQFNVRSATPVPAEEPSCCLAFLESLNVDRDQSPCNDFQSYVCPRNVSQTFSFRWNTWNAREALDRSRDHPEALSGRMLAVLRAQCEALLDHGPRRFVRAMGPAMLHAAQVPRSANADQLLLFMAFVSLKLLVKMPVHISIVDTFYPTLRVEVPLADLVSTFSFFNHTCSECIDDVLDVAQDHTGNSIRRTDFFAFEASFTQLLDSGVSTCGPNLFQSLGARRAWETLTLDIFEAYSQQ